METRPGGPSCLPRWSDETVADTGFNGAVAAIVDYLCASEEHQVAEDAASPVIRCDGGWGYCPAGAPSGHDWRATGGRTLATVREWMRRPVTIGT
jgi:hypothetical protein